MSTVTTTVILALKETVTLKSVVALVILTVVFFSWTSLLNNIIISSEEQRGFKWIIYNLYLCMEFALTYRMYDIGVKTVAPVRLVVVLLGVMYYSINKETKLK